MGRLQVGPRCFVETMMFVVGLRIAKPLSLAMDLEKLRSFSA